MTMEEEMAYYRSRHASARKKTDEDLKEFIRFAKFMGNLIFESETEKLRERRKITPLLLEKGYTREEIESYYNDLNQVVPKVSRENLKIDEDYKKILNTENY